MTNDHDHYDNQEDEWLVTVHLHTKGVVTTAVADLVRHGPTVPTTGEARAYQAAAGLRKVRQNLATSRALDELARRLWCEAADEYSRISSAALGGDEGEPGAVQRPDRTDMEVAAGQFAA